MVALKIENAMRFVTPLIVVLVVLALGAAILFPAVQASREAARRMQCGNNTRIICLGLQNYHDTFLHLPYGARNRTTGKQADVSWGSSWLLAMQPFMECGSGYDKINAADAAAAKNDYLSAAIRGLHHRGKYKYMLCPSSPLPETQQLSGCELVVCNYAGILGATNELEKLVDDKQRIVAGPYGGWAAANGMLLLNESTTLEACKDGMANTIIVGEVSSWYFTDSGLPRNAALNIADAGDGPSNAAGWMAGTDLKCVVTNDGSAIPADRVCNLVAIHHPLGMNNRATPNSAPDWGSEGIGRCSLNNPLLAEHPAGAMVGFVDARVVLLTKNISPLVLKRLAIRDDGSESPEL